MGGEYFTVIPDDEGRKQKVYLYKLENLGIIAQERTKEHGAYTYKWNLTKKGGELVESDNHLKELWESQNLKDFYEEIEKIK